VKLDLEGRAFLVAGGTAGLGLGVACLLAEEGARVSICGRDPVRLEGALEVLRGHDPHARGMALDLRDGLALERWVEESSRAFGRLDGLLVNAGGPPRGGLDAFDDAAWQDAWTLTLLSAVRLARAARPHLRDSGGGSILAAFDDAAWQDAWTLTLLSAVRLARAARPHLRDSGGGSILAVTSGSAREPIDSLLLSNVLRPGVAALMNSLSRTLAGEGIRCNSLAPGFIDTERLRSLEAAMAREGRRSPAEQEARLCAEVPLGRYGRVDEFARAAVFLLSPASSYISGVQVAVDGGRLRSLG